MWFSIPVTSVDMIPVNSHCLDAFLTAVFSNVVGLFCYLEQRVQYYLHIHLKVAMISVDSVWIFVKGSVCIYVFCFFVWTKACKYHNMLAASSHIFSTKQYTDSYFTLKCAFCVWMCVFVLIGLIPPTAKFNQWYFDTLGCQLVKNTAYCSHRSLQTNWVRDCRFYPTLKASTSI